MRLPRSKVWRAFPELDAYTDAECRAYVGEASRRRWLSGALLVTLGFVLGALAGWCLACLAWAAAGALGLTRPHSHAEWMAMTALSMLLVIASTGIGFLLVRDAWLRRALRLRLNRAVCGGCGYSLLGLVPMADGGLRGAVVVCPECGMKVLLRDAGLTPGDLMPRSVEAPTTGDAPPTSPPVRL